VRLGARRHARRAARRSHLQDPHASSNPQAALRQLHSRSRLASLRLPARRIAASGRAVMPEFGARANRLNRLFAGLDANIRRPADDPCLGDYPASSGKPRTTRRRNPGASRSCLHPGIDRTFRCCRYCYRAIWPQPHSFAGHAHAGGLSAHGESYASRREQHGRMCTTTSCAEPGPICRSLPSACSRPGTAPLPHPKTNSDISGSPGRRQLVGYELLRRMDEGDVKGLS